MAVTITEYDQFKDMALQGLDWDTDELKIALFTDTHTPATTATSFDDLTNECAGTGYTAGGSVLGNRAITAGAVTTDPVSWAEITVNVRYVMLYSTVTLGGVANPLLLIYDLGSELTLNAIPWAFSWAANTLYELT